MAASSSTDQTTQDEPLVEVRFFTSLPERWHITTASIQLPVRLTRAGLSEVINHLLLGINEEHKSLAFDFILNNELIRGSLGSALERQQLNEEAVAAIEYVMCIPPPKPQPPQPHKDWVSAVAAHPSGGRLLLSGTMDGSAFVWNGSMEKVASLLGHTAAVKGVAWLRGAEGGVLRAATASKDHTVRTWRVGPLPKAGAEADSAPCACEASLVGHASSVETLVANPSGDRLLSGAWDGSVLVWAAGEAQSGEEGAGAADGGGDARASKRSKGSKGGGAATAAPPAEVAPSGRLVGHAGSVHAVCWPTASLCYSGSWDGTVREWHVDVESTSATLAGQAAVIALDVSLASALTASGHTDHMVRVWDSRLQQAALQVRLPHKGWANAVRWHPQQEKLLASACYDGSVRLWDVRSSIPLHTLTAHEGKALCLCWDGAERVASGGSDEELRVTAITLPTGS